MTNKPKNNMPRNISTKNEIKKKNKYSAKKTVEENDEIVYEKIPSKKSINKEYIGRKREINETKCEKDESSNKNITNKVLYCFNCSWKFPDRMSLIRRNNHINSCFEGRGKLDIMKYTEEQRLKLYKNYSNKKIINLKVCPICGKEMGSSNLKSKQCHLNGCIKTSLNCL